MSKLISHVLMEDFWLLCKEQEGLEKVCENTILLDGDRELKAYVIENTRAKQYMQFFYFKRKLVAFCDYDEWLNYNETAYSRDYEMLRAIIDYSVENLMLSLKITPMQSDFFANLEESLEEFINLTEEDMDYDDEEDDDYDDEEDDDYDDDDDDYYDDDDD